MKISISGTVKPIIKDLRYVSKTLVPRVAAAALNDTARKKVEPPAIEQTSQSTSLSKGVIRWHHNKLGKRIKKRRLIRNKATKNRQFVGWRWSTKSGEPGRVSVISLPARRQTRSGVRAGRKGGIIIPGGFIQSNKRGQLGVYKRTSKARYPIEFQRVDMTSQADAAFTKAVNASLDDFQREYSRMLEVRLRKAAQRSARRAIRRLI